MKKTVVSGIRATGRMHLGNYYGALRHFARLGADPGYLCYFFIASLHSLTTLVKRKDAAADAAQMRQDTRTIVRDMLAVGVDPDRSVIYDQSTVPETTELAWILGCLTSVSELVGMPHFKDKRNQLSGLGVDANAGLLTYPVLMAADILGPLAHLVPVGEDQHPHVELTRDLARRFNARFEVDLFPIPGLIEEEAVRVPGLDGSGKMGKSESGGNAIWLDDPPEAVLSKLRPAVTDTARVRRTDPGNPEHCNVFALHRLVSPGEDIAWAQTGCTTAGIGCLECKMRLGEHVNTLLAPIQEKRREIDARGDAYIDEILESGGERARACIAPTVAEVKRLVGYPTL